MDFEKMVTELKEMHEQFAPFQQEKQKIYQQEASALRRLVSVFFPFATKKRINGEDCLLIFVFKTPDGEDPKTLISPEVYVSESGYVLYQVYDEFRYRGYQPEAEIINGFVVKKIEEFVEFISLEEICHFFVDRADVLFEYIKEAQEEIEQKKKFLKDFYLFFDTTNVDK